MENELIKMENELIKGAVAISRIDQTGRMVNPLRSGCSYYTHAIVASVDPFVLISEQGDMMWRSTVEPDDFIFLCKAHSDVMKIVDKRLADEAEADSEAEAEAEAEDLI